MFKASCPAELCVLELEQSTFGLNCSYLVSKIPMAGALERTVDNANVVLCHVENTDTFQSCLTGVVDILNVAIAYSTTT